MPATDYPDTVTDAIELLRGEGYTADFELVPSDPWAYREALVTAFRRYETARYLRTARVSYESRYLWDNFYHLGGIEREVMREAWTGRSEDEMFDCLAWLYDGFKLPDNVGKAA